MLGSAVRWNRTMMACGNRLSNPAVERTAGSHSLAAAAHRGVSRYPESFLGLRGNEWVKRGAESAETRAGSGRKHWGGGQESGMIGACELRPARAGCGIRIAFRDSARVRLSPGSSVILTPASSPSRAGQKNSLWDLRAASARVVRPQTAQGPGSRLRRPADLPRRRGPARGLPALWQGEARAARVPSRQSPLHQALCRLCGAALSGVPDPGCGQRTAARLARRLTVRPVRRVARLCEPRC